MFFADIHNHLLYGADDGPETFEAMTAMLDASYADGVRLICATPHFYPKFFGDNSEKSLKAFNELCEYANGKYHDLKILLGNELFFTKGSSTWLKNGVCRTLGGTRFALFEFTELADAKTVFRGAERLLNRGFIPILAHAERYLRVGRKDIEKLKKYGVRIQVNASTFGNAAPLWFRTRLRWLMSKKLVDFVSTDAHDLDSRSPKIKKYFETVSKKYGKDYAADVFWNNAEFIFLKNVSEEENNG